MTTNLAARNGSGVLGGEGVRKALTTCTLNPPEPEQNPEALQQHASRPHCLGIPYLQPPKTSGIRGPGVQSLPPRIRAGVLAGLSWMCLR